MKKMANKFFISRVVQRFQTSTNLNFTRPEYFLFENLLALFLVDVFFKCKFYTVVTLHINFIVDNIKREHT